MQRRGDAEGSRGLAIDALDRDFSGRHGGCSTRAAKMTLGPSSLSLLSVLVLSGCAFGDVSGTGHREPDTNRSPNASSPPATSGDSNDSNGTSSALPEDSGPIDYDALFDAPADPTTTDGLVTGLWAGKTTYAESRLLLRANKVVIALKCGESPATGMEVGAVVTSNQIKILASKTVGSSTFCEIKVSPIAIPRCTTNDTYDCFELTDGTLYFSNKALFSSYSSTTYSTYTKLSD